MSKKLFLFVIVVLLLSGHSHAQPFRVFGKVVDDSTQTPIPFASVAISGLNLGTSSNVHGEFLIKLDSLPVDLVFSHVSYDKQVIRVASVDYLTVSLQPRKVLLEELVFEEHEESDFPYRLLELALDKALRGSRDWKYGLAYYRQTSSNDGDHSELYEIFYDTRYSSMGIVDWDIQEGRYAMKTTGEAVDYVFNKNFTLLTKLITMYQPETNDFVMPVHAQVRELYNLSISELIDVEGRKVATVNFDPKEEVTVPAMAGKILVDIENYDILKLEGQFKSDQLKFIALTNPQGSWKELTLDIEVAYNPRDEELFLDYISVHQSFDYYVEDQFQHKVETSSFLTYYEYYQPEKFKRLGGRLRRMKNSDREILDRMGYNKRFWEENPIVLRTPVEEEIISSFEAVNAFGSIYLNDRQQIELDKDELSNDPFVQQLNIDLMKAKIATFGEKVYLHFDKPYYGEGETMWFNAYIVNTGSLVLTDNSGVLYVDFISPEGVIMMHKRLVISWGLCEGSIDIPENLPSGNYRIRAYTNWMKNYDENFFFTRDIAVYNYNDDLYSKDRKKSAVDDFDVQFFPEGGDLVHNLPSQVAFKAIDTKGRGLDVEGKLTDWDGNTVVEFSSRHDGMGSFFMNPQVNRGYKAVVKYGRLEKEFKFPSVMEDGYAITVNNLKNRNIQITLKSSPTLNETELYIIGQSRGIMFHREKVSINRNSAVVSIPKAKFPDGITQLTIFNTNHIPLAERLVFINHEQDAFASIETGNTVPGPREEISLKLQVKDEYGKPVRNTSFSIAITDAGHLLKSDSRETIKTNLLLSSDLNGNIHNPGFYFLNDDRDTRIALDLVMLTHGWRKFSWEQIREGSLEDVSFVHEHGIDIRGIAMNQSERLIPNAFLQFIPLKNDFFGLWETTTNLESRFELRGLIIPDSTQVVVKYLNERGRAQNAMVQFDLPELIMPDMPDRSRNTVSLDDEVLHYVEKHQERKIAYSLKDVEEKVILKEIIVRDTEIEDEPIYGKPDNVIIVDEALSNLNNVFQILQGRVPGVQVTGEGVNAQVRIRGTNTFSGDNTPLFVVDGIPLSTPMVPSSALDTLAGSDTAPTFSSLNSSLMSISPRDIERIEVLKNASATMYGVRGGNGVIVIYTRRGPADYEMESTDISQDIIYLPGFSPVREYYHPKYDGSEEDDPSPDKRTTIYWEPSVVTNNLGTAEITFYNSDDARRLQVDLQGVTDYGSPVIMNAFIGEEVIK